MAHVHRPYATRRWPVPWPTPPKESAPLPPALTPDELQPRNPIEDAGDIIRRTSGPVLWHYTNQAGMLGMVQDRCLWLSNIAYVNDTRELRHALDVVRVVAAEMTGPARESEHRLRSLLAQQLDTWRDDRHSGYAVGVYIFSLSELDDDLSQWRGYCPTGNGFSLGFETRRLQMFMAQLEFRSPARLVRCEYNPEVQERIVANLLRNAVSEHADKLDRGARWEEAAGEFWQTVERSILNIAPTLKHPSFRAEKEWRIVVTVDAYEPSRPRCRLGRAIPVPFVEMSYKSAAHLTFPIRHIRAGPTQYPELARASCVTALSGFMPLGAGLPMVFSSDVPFRHW